MGEAQGAALLDRPPFASVGDRWGLACLRDFHAAPGERVQQRRLAVLAGVLANADGCWAISPCRWSLTSRAGTVLGARSGKQARPIMVRGTSPARSSSARIA